MTIDLTKIQNRSKFARKFLLGIATSVLAIGIALFTLLFIDAQYETDFCYNIVTSTLFALTGLACTLLLIKLFRIIKEYYAQDLSNELKQLLICQTCFVMGFLIRDILIYIVMSGNWVDFTRDYPVDMDRTRMLPLQFIIYNFVPYMILIYFHWSNFRSGSVHNNGDSIITQPDVVTDDSINPHFGNERPGGVPLLLSSNDFSEYTNKQIKQSGEPL